MMHQPRAGRVGPTKVASLLLALIVILLAARNLPWHLDDYDQAKQAYVSYEMVESGQWWFQHTPDGKIATKPPLAGWISAALYFAFGKEGWEVAWRLPSYTSALVLLALLWRCGMELAGPRGAVLAACAFGFNTLTPRLATLVRTDAMLSLMIFLAGWLVFEKVRRAEPWTTRDRAWLALMVFGSLMTKGPILYAFLMPGLAFFWFYNRRRGLPNHAWAGWTPWFLPMLAFAAWVGVGIWMSHDFYRQVVLREFLGRFDLGEAPVHKSQPLYFYFPHLLAKWAPWGAALVALFCDRRVRARLHAEPALLWLVAWAVGGLVFMSLVPSKRVDRIFPVIPPLCLLLTAVADEWFLRDARRDRWRAAAIGIGAAICVAYNAAFIYQGFRDDERNLVRFGRQAREIALGRWDRFAVAYGYDEGLLLYTGKLRFLSTKDALRAWRDGTLELMIVREKDLREQREDLQPFHVVLETPKLKGEHSTYFLIERPSAPSQTSTRQ